jgi:hypothetical protein
MSQLALGYLAALAQDRRRPSRNHLRDRAEAAWTDQAALKMLSGADRAAQTREYAAF